MRFQGVHIFAAATIFQLASAKGPASPQNVGSSLRLLRQNDLNYTDAANHASTILLEPVTFSEATSKCGDLNEGLLDLNVTPNMKSDLASLISYLEFRKEFSASQAFWVAGSTAKQAQTVRLVDGKLIETPSRLDLKLPALCSQSAPFRPAGSSDKDSNFQVEVTSGPITFTGFRDQLSFRFFGIPYANPPGRWEYATLFNNRSVKTINAINAGSECWQTGSGPFSEDCLFLNIFTPILPTSHTDKSKLKPVLFWIHGGAFTGGTGSDATFDGGSMVSRGDVVLVTINYRLTTLGFLALDDGVTKGNYGLADQIVALQWVQQNIAAFGGDPSRVTIFGQSAGAASVRALLASPKAKGLFAAAIPMSNLAGLDFATTYSLYFTEAQNLQVTGEPVIRDAGCANATDVLACLKAVPPNVLVNLPDTAKFLTVDGTFLLTDQLELDGSSFAAHVPTLWGHMKDDGAAFIGFPQVGQSATSALLSIIGNQSQPLVNSGLFPQPNTGNTTLDVFNVTARVTTDIEFRCLDQATAVKAVKNKIFTTLFYYSFFRSYQTPGFDPNAPVCDAPKTATHPLGDTSLPYFQCHSGELFYVFGNLGQFNLPFRDENDIFMSQISLDHWVAFAWTHNPNPDKALLAARGKAYETTLDVVQKTSVWEPVDAANPFLRRLDFPTLEQNIAFQEKEQCDFFAFDWVNPTRTA